MSTPTRTRPTTGHRYRACGYRVRADGTAAGDASPWASRGEAEAAFDAMVAVGYERGVALQHGGEPLEGPIVIRWADGASA